MIHFVGAGPGAVDLITVKGKTLLETTDVVIYAGSLVNPDLLTYTKEGCDIYDSASMTLEAVISVMEEAHANEKDVVRLHTGDPSIYGAIREQMDLLERIKIPYEVIPGVSSFCGAAAALRAEYTLPDISQTVILTRLEGRTPVPPLEEMSLLASHQATMAIFLSVGMAKELKARLLKGGYKEETPVAIVYKATWPEQKIYRGTVGRLEALVAENNITKTALILVGEFLGDNYERSCLYDPAFTHEFREASVCKSE